MRELERACGWRVRRTQIRGLASGRATCGKTVVRESINEEAPLEGDQPWCDREVNVRDGSREMAVGAKSGEITAGEQRPREGHGFLEGESSEGRIL
jgi:hypothetical protein